MNTFINMETIHRTEMVWLCVLLILQRRNKKKMNRFSSFFSFRFTHKKSSIISCFLCFLPLLHLNKHFLVERTTYISFTLNSHYSSCGNKNHKFIYFVRNTHDCAHAVNDNMTSALRIPRESPLLLSLLLLLIGFILYSHLTISQLFIHFNSSSPHSHTPHIPYVNNT